MNPVQLLEHFERLADAPDSIPLLRRFILDLAVRGRLIAQDPNDESGTELLKRIQAEKARLVSEGILKHQSRITTAVEERAEIATPRGWALTTLGEVAHKITDGTHKTPTYVSEGVPFVSVKDFSGGRLDFSHTRRISRKEHTMLYKRCDPQRGDILICRIGTLGKAVLVDSDQEFSLFVSVGLIRFSQKLMAPNYVRLLLNSPLAEMEYDRIKVGGGTHTNKLNLGDLHSILVPLPPLAEQHRIVAKVYELMALCDRLETTQTERKNRRHQLATTSLHYLSNGGIDDNFDGYARFCLSHFQHLTTRSEQIPTVRQTILNLAIRGRLISQDRNDEPAARFLGDRQLVRDSATDPWKLPSGWAWSSFGLIGETLGGGTPSKGNPEFWKGSIPWVSPKDMKVDEINDAQDHISPTAVEQSAVRLISKGSLLMVVRGMILAHSFPTAINTVPVTINQDMKAIVPFRADLIRFLLLLTKGLKPEVLRLVLRSTHGTCKLLTDDLFSMPIPIPPLAEQRRIVDKVNELMALCDRLGKQLNTAQTESRHLLEAILDEALNDNRDRRGSFEKSYG
jgi:type I restriction enzyme S subunit